MKKLIAAFMIFLFLNFSINLVYASFISSAITRLQPAAAVAGSAGSKIIPAVFSGTAAGGNVSSWISLAIPGGALGRVAGAVIGVAGALAIDYVFGNASAWFTGKGIDSLLKQSGAVNVTNGYTLADYPSNEYGFGGDFANYTAVMAAATAMTCPDIGGCSAPNYGKSCGSLSGDAKGHFMACGCCSGRFVAKFYYVDAAPYHSEIKTVQLAPATVQAMLTTDLAANNADAVKVGQAALEVATAALDNPSHPVNQNAAIKAAMAAALMEGVTADQKTALEGQAAVPGAVPVPVTTTDPTTYLTPAQIAAAVQAALSGQGLSAAQIAAAIAAATSASGSQSLTQAETQAAVAAALSGQNLSAAQIAAAIAAANPALTAAQVQAAVSAAINDETGVAAVVDPTIIIPDKKNLTTVMGSFMTAINSLPMMDTLRGMTINVSGSSQLCLDLPVGLGGQKCFDGSRMQGGLNMIGSALLGLTTIFSFLGIFKG